MPDPLSFPDATPRHGLPLLFAGQAQKEFFVNEALTRLDLLVHARIAGRASQPPAAPQAGESWLVDDGAVGAWAGQTDSLAGWTGSGWLFCAPSAGLRVWDISLNAFRIFTNGWNTTGAPTQPQGGTVVDAEARSALNDLVNALIEAGILLAP
ncbi:MAG: DUF2793 domain-containing protein [Sphingomonadaceae bacterium]